MYVQGVDLGSRLKTVAALQGGFPTPRSPGRGGSMNKPIVFIAIGAALVIQGCATAPPVYNPTASGWPEATFKSSNVGSVAGKIASQCSARGQTVDTPSAGQVICSKSLSGMQAAVVYMILGSNSENPTAVTQYTVFQDGADVRVQARMYFQVDSRLGQPRRSEARASQIVNEVQSVLDGLVAASE